MTRNQFIRGVLVIFALCFAARAQDVVCSGYDKTIRYQVLSDNITVKNSHKRIFLEVYVKQDRFNIGSMVKLVEAVKLKYCDFDSIVVAFYNTRKREKIPDPPPQPLSAWFGTPTSGFYEYEKQANTASLSFREKRNDKIYSVEVEFNESGYCVSEEIYQPDRPSEP